MIGAIGQLFLFLALLLSFWNMIFNVRFLLAGNAHDYHVARNGNALHFFWMGLAFAILILGFVLSDFSLKLVYMHSHTSKPLLYKISASWGNHEGSMLLWVLILSTYSYGFIRSAAKTSRPFKSRVMLFLSFVQAAFLIFILWLSNPFDLLLHLPENGMGLNPLLQDPGLAYHPPILYLGYVGTALTAAILIGMIFEKKIGIDVFNLLRCWSFLAWGFLTLGVTLGSFWAYYELGWGGWWFWDPVENVALIPWLLGLIMIHFITSYRAQKFYLHGIFLFGFLSFIFSLVGTFIVRSGILISVHSFAVDPARGVFILTLVTLISALVWGIYILKIQAIEPRDKCTKRSPFLAKETIILIAYMLVIIAVSTLAFGTLYPLLHEVLFGNIISVGAPYFNGLIVPIALTALIFMGFVPFLKWRKYDDILLKKAALICAGSFLIVTPFLWDQWLILLASGLLIWLAISSVYAFFNLFKTGGYSYTKWGILLGHLGMGLCVFGMSFSSFYGEEKLISMAPNEQVEFQNYEVKFAGVKRYQMDNYETEQAHLIFSKPGAKVLHLYPERRYYPVSKTLLAETAIDHSLMRDIYTVLLRGFEEALEDQNKNLWAIRLYYQPFVIWIWVGGFLMALAVFIIALWPGLKNNLKRRRL